MSEQESAGVGIAQTAADTATEAMQVAELLAARTYAYELFAKCFGGEPTSELHEVLTSSDTANVCGLYAQECKELANLRALLTTFTAKDTTVTLDVVHDEYTRMFEGPGALPAPPYRAPYTGSRDEALFQEATLEVRRVYHAGELRLRREQAVPDDHVAALLGFAAHKARELARRAGTAGADGKQLADTARQQHVFVAGYLADWLSTYATLVRNSRAGQHAVLYPQLLEATAAFVQVDCVFLTEMSYWLEQAMAAGRSVAVLLTQAANSSGPSSFLQAADALRELSLPGFGENELVTFDRQEG